MKKNSSTIAALLLAIFAAFSTFAYPAAASGTTQSTPPTPVNRAFDWIRTQQAPDGSFAGFGTGSTVDAVLAIIAANGDPTTYTQGSNSPITYLETQAPAYSANIGGAGKLLIATQALSMDARSFGSIDLVGAINASYGISGTGQYGPDVISHAFSILGLHAAGQAVPADAIARLKVLQTPEGGWAFSGDTAANAGDTNTTAVVAQALVAVGADKSEADTFRRATSYLASQQNADGGWPYQQGSEFGSDSDVNSTSYVVQAMLAAGNSALAAEGQSFILSLQNSSGAFPYSKLDPTDSPGATYQAAAALLGATLDQPRVPAPAAPTATPVPSATAAPPVQPGMPVTGSGFDWMYLATLLALAATLASAGTALRRSR